MHVTHVEDFAGKKASHRQGSEESWITNLTVMSRFLFGVEYWLNAEILHDGWWGS